MWKYLPDYFTKYFRDQRINFANKSKKVQEEFKIGTYIPNFIKKLSIKHLKWMLRGSLDP